VKKVLTGFDAIHDHIHGVGQCTLALRDYFPWYFSLLSLYALSLCLFTGLMSNN
jgi:hypothetical protein